jgi:hypothetical protein
VRRRAASQPIPPVQANAGPAAVLARATAAAEALVAAGRWNEADDAMLDEAFDDSARAALAVPSLAERAPGLRRIARLVVPAGLRPGLGRLARRVDAIIRRLAGVAR